MRIADRYAIKHIDKLYENSSTSRLTCQNYGDAQLRMFNPEGVPT